jgi:hypothetical protein
MHIHIHICILFERLELIVHDIYVFMYMYINYGTFQHLVYMM